MSRNAGCGLILSLISFAQSLSHCFKLLSYFASIILSTVDYQIDTRGDDHAQYVCLIATKHDHVA